MPSSSAVASGNGIEQPEQNTKDDEYERLVRPAHSVIADDNTVVLPEEPTSRSIWWMKVLLGCFLLILVSYVFVKWGVPFAFEKVSIKGNICHRFIGWPSTEILTLVLFMVCRQRFLLMKPPLPCISGGFCLWNFKLLIDSLTSPYVPMYTLVYAHQLECYMNVWLMDARLSQCNLISSLQNFQLSLVFVPCCAR